MNVSSNNTPRKIRTIRKGPWLLMMITIACLGLTVWLWDQAGQLRTAAVVSSLLLIISLAAFGQVITTSLDDHRQLVTLTQRRLWSKQTREISYRMVHSVGVTSSSAGEGVRYGVVLGLHSGERLPITAHPGSGRAGKVRLARRIAAALENVLERPVTLALDGTIKVEKTGTTRGIDWEAAWISANDSVQVTQWLTRQVLFPEGFLLMIPAQAGRMWSAKGTQPLNPAQKVFFQQYFRMLGVNGKDIPGWNQGIVWDGNGLINPPPMTLLTSHPGAAEAWLTGGFTRRIDSWIRENPLQARKGEREPHLLVTPSGFTLMFRRVYSDELSFQAIGDFSVDLIRELGS